MAILKNTHYYLSRIINSEEKFTTILNRSLLNAKLSSQEVNLIRDSLKAIVNKYYFVRYEIKQALKQLDLQINDNDFNILIILVSMIQYVKSLSREDVINHLYQELDELETELSFDVIKSILDNISDKPIEIPEKVNQTLYKKVALQYSYPEWVVKMLFKHFGVKDIYKSIISSRKSQPIVVNYNRTYIDGSELDNELFKKTNLADTAYAYLGKEKIISLKLFKDNKIFVEDETSQLLIDKLDPRQGEEMLFIDDSNGVLALDACLRSNDFSNIQVCCKDSLSLHATNNIINRFQLGSVTAFESDMKLLITHVEPRKMDKVLLVAPSSNFGLVRRHPDILLSFRRDNLDNLIENQKNALLEAERFVKNDGVLLYAVYTMNLKEGQNIIKEFLETHEEYSLLEERQIFPYYGPSDGIYYAKMKKVG